MKTPVESYVVRIYRRQGGAAKRLLVGLVEAASRSGGQGFTSMEQLWEILAVRPPARRTNTRAKQADETQG